LVSITDIVSSILAKKKKDEYKLVSWAGVSLKNMGEECTEAFYAFILNNLKLRMAHRRAPSRVVAIIGTQKGNQKTSRGLI